MLAILAGCPSSRSETPWFGVQVLSEEEYMRRKQFYQLSGQRHYYFMNVGNGEVIDACRKVILLLLPLELSRTTSFTEWLLPMVAVERVDSDDVFCDVPSATLEQARVCCKLWRITLRCS